MSNFNFWKNEITVGKIYQNPRNGGQQVTVNTTSFNGMEDVIGYELHEPWRFGSKSYSHCDIEEFRKTFEPL